jgi:Protein  of unknown function (DUF3018)
VGYEKPLTGAERVAKRRAALRAQGLKPRTLWLPDTNSLTFKRRAEADVAWLWAHIKHNEDAVVFAEAMADDVLADVPVPRWRDDA